jgi:hypothetical protein
MNKLRLNLVALFLVTGLLAACGQAIDANSNKTSHIVPVINYNQIEYTKAVAILRQLDNAINNGELDEAVSLFGDDANIEIVNPPYLKYTEPVNIWQLSDEEGGVDLVTRIPSIRVTVHYSGKEWVNAYLFSLVASNYKGEFSKFKPDEDTINWSAKVALDNYHVQMDFDAVVEQGSIQSLTVKFSNLVSN